MIIIQLDIRQDGGGCGWIRYLICLCLVIIPVEYSEDTQGREISNLCFKSPILRVRRPSFSSDIILFCLYEKNKQQMWEWLRYQEIISISLWNNFTWNNRVTLGLFCNRVTLGLFYRNYKWHNNDGCMILRSRWWEPRQRETIGCIPEMDAWVSVKSDF